MKDDKYLNQRFDGEHRNITADEGGIYYKVQNFIAPLCSIQGSCLVQEFSLDKQVLAFSNVVIGYHRTKHILLRNTGDLPIKFKWACNTKLFKLSPIEGLVKEKSEMKIEVRFKTHVVKCDIMKMCKCVIDNKHILELKLVANSIVRPPPIQKIQFSCPVRQSVSQTIKITNKTLTLWKTKAIVKSKNFIVPSEIVVQPKSETTITVEYHPRVMICERVFLIIPLAEAELFYQLEGCPNPPLPEKRINIEVKCKQNHCEGLPVFNWTHFKQCLAVETVLLKKTGHASSLPLYNTFGREIVEVLPGEVKEYKWNIYVLNEAVLEFQVIFKDTNSNEYMFYEIVVKGLPSETVDTLYLRTMLRTLVTTKIKLANPIKIPVIFKIHSAHRQLVYPEMVTVAPYTAQDVEIKYFPVKLEEFSTTLEAKCEQLGEFTYKLILAADPPGPQRTIQFKAELGGKGRGVAEIRNTFESSLEMSVKFSNPEFSLEKSEKVNKVILPGEIGRFTMLFEPSQPGILKADAVYTSAVSGPFVFHLEGECVLSTSKGPFLIKNNTSTVINFFNPFYQTQLFYLTTCDSQFSVKPHQEIAGRAISKITVSFKADDPKKVSTSRLIVTCGDFKWVFYLQSDT